MFGLFGKRESAEDVIERLANAACEAVEGEFERFWLRAWKEGDTIEVALFALFTPAAFRQVALSAKTSGSLQTDLGKLWDIHRKSEPQPWTEMTLNVSAEGKFALSFGYEKLGLNDVSRRTDLDRVWRERHCPALRVAGIQSPALKPLVREAEEKYRALTVAHDALWRLGRAQSWHVDQGRGVIEFRFADGTTATAPAQILGSWNATEQRWLWAWANPSVSEPMRQHALNARSYGQQHKLPELTSPDVNCDESTAWELACVAASLAQAGGVYRASTNPASVFLTYGPVMLSQ
jgi:hypothetical protein